MPFITTLHRTCLFVTHIYFALSSCRWWCLHTFGILLVLTGHKLILVRSTPLGHKNPNPSEHFRSLQKILILKIRGFFCVNCWLCSSVNSPQCTESLSGLHNPRICSSYLNSCSSSRALTSFWGAVVQKADVLFWELLQSDWNLNDDVSWFFSFPRSYFFWWIKQQHALGRPVKYECCPSLDNLLTFLKWTYSFKGLRVSYTVKRAL